MPDWYHAGSQKHLAPSNWSTGVYILCLLVVQRRGRDNDGEAKGGNGNNGEALEGSDDYFEAREGSNSNGDYNNIIILFTYLSLFFIIRLTHINTLLIVF